LAKVAVDKPRGSWRVRMTVSRSAHVSVALVQLEDDSAAGGGGASSRRVKLADRSSHSGDRPLHRKTTARGRHDEQRAAQPGAFAALLHNEHGCITEFTTGNVVCEIDGARVTPPRSAGLLGGTFREQLLLTGEVREADIAVGDLARVERMWLVNSVREWVLVQLG